MPLPPLPKEGETNVRKPAPGHKIIGIDFGMSKSMAAIMEGGRPLIIPSAVPSVVAVDPKTGERAVGHAAQRRAVSNAENTMASIKRFMGRKYTDPQVQRAIKWMPCKLSAAPNGDVRVHLGGKQYSPPEVSAMLLARLKTDAEAYLGETVTQAVITVPADFNAVQRQAIKDAGRIAGLEVRRILSAATASALAYGLDMEKEETIAVYDLGGGTFDVSILCVDKDVFEVCSTFGHTFLGGDDFDQRVIDWMGDEFRKEHGVDLRKDRQALQRLKEAAEKAKIELSTTLQTEINLPFITAGASGPKDLKMTLTRVTLEQLCGELIERSVDFVRRALEDARLKPENVDKVVLVGGMTRMPAVQAAVRQIFNKEPHKGLNPDEAAAMGAAIYAGVLAGEGKGVLLLDVTPLTLSIETLGGLATPLIERNSLIPTAKSQIFSTTSDKQTDVEIKVVQGERPFAADNQLLGNFTLDGIPPAPRGVPQIEVAFAIDADGILTVSALDKATGRSQHITIAAPSGLSNDEVERMAKEAEKDAAEDKNRRDVAEMRHAADAAALAAEKALREQGSKVSAKAKASMRRKIDAVRKALGGRNPAAIKKAADDLNLEALSFGKAELDR